MRDGLVAAKIAAAVAGARGGIAAVDAACRILSVAVHVVAHHAVAGHAVVFFVFAAHVVARHVILFFAAVRRAVVGRTGRRAVGGVAVLLLPAAREREEQQRRHKKHGKGLLHCCISPYVHLPRYPSNSMRTKQQETRRKFCQNACHRH